MREEAAWDNGVLESRGKWNCASFPLLRHSNTPFPILHCQRKSSSLDWLRMQNAFAVAGHWQGRFDEKALQAFAEKLRGELKAPSVSLGLVFISPPFFSVASQILE